MTEVFCVFVAYDERSPILLHVWRHEHEARAWVEQRRRIIGSTFGYATTFSLRRMRVEEMKGGEVDGIVQEETKGEGHRASPEAGPTA